jgi:hypothetical protein
MAKASKQYVLIKNTKEKLEVISVTDNVTKIKNTKGEFYNVPNDYLISLEEYLFIKSTKKKTL